VSNSKISALASATTPLAGTETLPIVQSGSTVKVAVSYLTAGRAISATSITASTGNFIVGTSGQGIDFSVTPGTGTSELFSDYEEGNFNPRFFYGGTEVGYYSSGGKYTKIGRQVFCIASGYFSRGAGAVSFGGLPFTSATWSGQPDIQAGTTGRDYPTSTDFTGFVDKGATTGSLNYSFTGAGDSEIRMFIVYFV
jgi:hypothetical protein